MRIAVRIIICTFLVAAAVTMAVFTLAGFSPVPGRTSQTAAAPERDSLYVLGAQDGLLAIFGRDDPTTPLTVTDIELASLRETDRALITEGLPVDTPEELAQLLEDLGN